MERNPPCPHCGGHATREGSLKIKKAQAFKYFCTRCGACFSTFTGTIFHYLNAVPRVVALATETLLHWIACSSHGPTLTLPPSDAHDAGNRKRKRDPDP